jgi:CRISPR/Cas system CSM-associated protein Csm4 (group 5 of RAMP superfamily)
MAKRVMKIPGYKKGDFYFAKDGYLYVKPRSEMQKSKRKVGGNRKKSKKVGKKKFLGIF